MFVAKQGGNVFKLRFKKWFIYIYRVGLEFVVISKQGTFIIEKSTKINLKKIIINERTTDSLMNIVYFSLNLPYLRQFET